MMEACSSCGRWLSIVFFGLISFACTSYDIYMHEHETLKSQAVVDRKTISVKDFIKLAKLGPLSGRYLIIPSEVVIRSPIYLSTESGLDIISEGGVTIRGDIYTQGIVIKSGGISVSGINFKGLRNCISIERGDIVEGLTISNIHAEEVHDCVIIERGTNAHVADIIITDIIVDGYHRSAIRLAGQATMGVEISRFRLDGGYSASYCWKGGIQIYGNVENVTLEDGYITNNIGDCDGGYPQGDGVEIDHKNGIPKNIHIENVHVSNSKDSNFDLKGMDVSLKNITSSTSISTNSAYKIWAYHYECSDCVYSGSFKHVVESKYGAAISEYPKNKGD